MRGSSSKSARGEAPPPLAPPEFNLCGLGGYLDEAVDGFFAPELKRRYIRDSNETMTATHGGGSSAIEFVVHDEEQQQDAEPMEDMPDDPKDWQDIFVASATVPHANSKKRDRANKDDQWDGARVE